MKTKQIRNITFTLHRYLGLALGLMILIIGITGSLLVFHKQIDEFLVTQKFGQITPEGETASLTMIVNSLKENYSEPKFKISSVGIPEKPNLPYQAWLASSEGKYIEAFINPYTAKVLGTRPLENTFFGWIYRLHFQLLGGEIGTKIVGIVALLWVILSLTGIILWPGWRKLITGFKIKWNAHPKRVNFDIHKVTGIIVGAFLAIIAFTGFCWNFYDQSVPLIYAATFTPKAVEPTSKVIPNQSPLTIDKLVEKGRNAIPEADVQRITIPQESEGAFEIRKKFPQSLNNYGQSSVYVDQYSGEILQVKNELKPSRAEAILNSFLPLHYGTFAGLPSQIFYIFVGIAPAILLITSLKMTWYRRKPKKIEIPPSTEMENSSQQFSD